MLAEIFMRDDMLETWKHGHVPSHNYFSSLCLRNPVLLCVVQDQFQAQSTRRLPMPRYIQWMNQSGTLKITHKLRVKFSIGNYVDTVDCDVAPMSACHLLLGRP